jgi:hypothetical protein
VNAAAVLLVVAVLVFFVHRVALWAEAHGWIYYLRRRPQSSALGNAFLEVQALIEPEKKQLVEVRKEDVLEEDFSGEPPEAGTN